MGAQLTFGVRFLKNKPLRSSQLPLLKEIEEVLRKRGFDLQSSEGFWIGWWRIRDYSLKDIEILARVSADEGFASAGASFLYELADEVGGAMRDLDEALAQADKSIESS